MKKFVLAAVAFLGSLGIANAQDLTLKGSSAVNIGIGLGHRFDGSMSIPPLSVAYDYSLVSGLINGNNGSITLGAYGAYVGVNWSYNGISSSASHTVLGARGMFHYQFAPKLDTYAGLMLGYHIASYSSSTPYGSSSSVSGSGIDLGLVLGARYYFTEKFGLFTELGYSLPYWNIGVTFRL